MKKAIYIAALILFSRCHSPIPESSVWVDELNLYVDTTEVTVQKFQEFKTFFDVSILTDSVKNAVVFDTSKKKFMRSETAHFRMPDGVIKSDSLLPAVQISWQDACNYCNAKNGRLPTSEEWIAITEGEFIPGNIWEGFFPLKDEGLDGYDMKAAKAGSFSPNQFGLYDLYGNVREWTFTEADSGKYEIKGGSYLSDYNSGAFLPEYFCAEPPNSVFIDVGFRCVYDR